MTVGPEGRRAVEGAITDACVGRGAGDAIRADLRAFLLAHGVPADDVAAMTEAPRRLAVYRSLVQNGLAAVVVRMLPKTRARMNASCDGRFDADFARFLDEAGPRTHYLRDVPSELLVWAAPRWRADPSVPAYLTDLASFEIAHFAVAASEANTSGSGAREVALDRPLAFSPSSRVLRYRWAVHELPDDEEDREVPAERAVQLLAYRDADHTVRWLELTPLATLILEKLQSGESLGPALTSACESMGTRPADVLGEVAALLADLGERGVVLGGG
ncbi:MAG: DNA-binding domain-containing protein [Polyangiaceae bacterium]